MTSTVDVSKFDFCKPEIRANPWPYYRALQAQSPILIQKEIPWALISRYEDIIKVVHDHEAYSSVRPEGLPGTAMHDPFPGVPTMVFSDPPQHTRLHSILAPSLTKARTEAAVPLIREIVDRVLEQTTKGKRQIDGVTDIGKALPIKVLGGMRGMSDAEIDGTFGLMFGAVSTGEAKDPSKMGATIAAFCAKMAEVRGGKTDGQDPISISVAAREQKKLDDLEFLGMVTLSMIAGILTITETISGALYQMLMRPAVHEKVKADRSLIPLLIEESLRYDPPVHMNMRTTTRETEVGGLRIPSRTPVLVLWAAGNRDPRKFPNPDDFDITRTNVKDHLAFGQGIHYCIGHWLGRVVSRVAFEGILDRFPRMRLAEGFTPVWAGTPVTRGLEHLPILVD